MSCGWIISSAAFSTNRFLIDVSKEFHPTELLIDTKTLGPADIITLNYTEDNPGRWLYHCHVFSHLHMGMNGWYIVSD